LEDTKLYLRPFLNLAKPDVMLESEKLGKEPEN
jgi:hypothetical protein